MRALFVSLIVIMFMSISFVSRAAQTADSLDYSQFEKQLRRYFSEQQTRGIISKLPAKCKIFGFDAGDYSGDGLADVILSARADEHERKEVGVYFFIGEGDDFRLIKTMNRKYVSEPIEIGFSIESGICSVTQKLGEYHWRITGYGFEHSVFRILTLWETSRLPGLRDFSTIGMEFVDDFRSNRSIETFFRASDSKTLFRTEFDALPVFPAMYKTPEDVNRWIGDSSSRPILRGSSSWHGVDDCAVFASGCWDTTSIHLDLVLFDDRLLQDTSADRSDYLDIWFDVSGKSKVDAAGKPRFTADGDVIAIRLFPSEADSASLRMEFIGGWETRRTQRNAVRCSIRRADYRSLRIRCDIPKSLFPPQDRQNEISFATSYHDVDNPEHPDWVTVIASSPRFEDGRPATFGRLDFYPEAEVPFEREDQRLLPILSRMNLAGMRH
jgi:hypothetical protein